MKLSAPLFTGILFLFFLTSCKQELQDDCSRVSPASVTFNSPLTAGDDLQLKLSNIVLAQSFLWKGPDGFSSTEQNPLIKHVQSDKAGKYSVTMFLAGGCIAKAVSDSVVIKIPEAPCSPANNSASLDGVSYMSFSGWSGAASGSSYFVEDNSSGGTISLEFPGTTKPVPGIYGIQPLSGEWITGFVRVRFISGSSNWPASSGKVYITKSSNNKLIISFCKIPVFSQTFFYGTTASGRIIEK